jgi:hypothetical protein
MRSVALEREMVAGYKTVVIVTDHSAIDRQIIVDTRNATAKGRWPAGQSVRCVDRAPASAGFKHLIPSCGGELHGVREKRKDALAVAAVERSAARCCSFLPLANFAAIYRSAKFALFSRSLR